MTTVPIAARRSGPSVLIVEDDAETRDALVRELSQRGYRVDESAGMDLWTGYLSVGTKIPAEMQPMLAQLASCVMFDVVIDNADRWTGNNTKGSVDRKTLYFMDNTLSFSIYTLGHQPNYGALLRIQVFSRSLIARLRTLTQDEVTAAITKGDDGELAPLLNPTELRAVIGRRDHIVEYVDKLIAKYGEDAVLAFP